MIRSPASSKRAVRPRLPQLEDQFSSASDAFQSFVASVNPPTLKTIQNIDTVENRLVELYSAVQLLKDKLLKSFERAGSREELVSLQKKLDDLHIQKLDLEEKILSQRRFLMGNPPTECVSPTKALGSQRVVTSQDGKKRHSKPLTSDEESEDEEVQLARIALERAILDAKERKIKARSELGRSQSGVSASYSSRTRDWVDRHRTTGEHEKYPTLLNLAAGSATAPELPAAATSVAATDLPAATTAAARELPAAATPAAGSVVPVVEIPAASSGTLSAAMPAETDQRVRSRSRLNDLPALSSDGASRYLLISDLKKVPAHPYQGEPHLFNNWLNNLQRKMNKLSVDALDAIEILQCHTVGAPKRLIETLSVSIGNDPESQFQDILKELKRRFGSSHHVALSLYSKLLDLPDIRGNESDPSVVLKLREFSDSCLVVKHLIDSTPDLQILNQAIGLEPIRKKLPAFAVNAWRRRKARHEVEGIQHPSFQIFTEFLSELSHSLCEDLTPSSFLDTSTRARTSNTKPLRVFHVKTDATKYCILHKSDTHGSNSCRTIAKMDSSKKRDFMRQNKLCFRCLGPHTASQCQHDVKCETCGMTNHCTGAHMAGVKRRNFHAPSTNPKTSTQKSRSMDDTTIKDENSVASLCTQVCGIRGGRSCSKTLLADVFDKSGHSCRVYVIIDEMSRNSFCSPTLLDAMNFTGPKLNYTVSTLTGHRVPVSGRCITGLKIKGVSEDKLYDLPPLLENSMIPNDKDEIATPELVSKHPAIAGYSNLFLPIDNDAEVAVLLGRDSDMLISSTTEQLQVPYVHRTVLGYAVVGSICPMSYMHGGRDTVALRTSSLLCDHFEATPIFHPKQVKDVFSLQADDEMSAESPDDRKFFQYMTEIRENDAGYLEAPLPFKVADVSMPDNRQAVLRRQQLALSRLKRDPGKLSKCMAAMQKNIERGHVEQITDHKMNVTAGKSWYLPVFPVCQANKANKLRLVFDSAAVYYGVSLNSCLLSGPDQNNKLRDVLTKFREEPVAFVADVESMFHAFYVTPAHRNFLRFHWWTDNDPSKELTSFRANVHVFGNTSSPAVATMCLRIAATSPQNSTPHQRTSFLKHAQDYIIDHFYCDDGLGTAPNPDVAIGTLKAAISLLSRFKIRLHKIVSNSLEVTQAFPESERAISTDVSISNAPTHRTLGVSWNTVSDCFIIEISVPQRPFTKRGLLSVVNSVYDPIGFVSPVTLGGRLILRKILSPSDERSGGDKVDWDDPLPPEQISSWCNWLRNLEDLHLLSIPRCFYSSEFGKPKIQTLHIFADASLEAISYVAYLRSVSCAGETQVSFVRGESRVAPRAATSVPRLELCAAVEAVHAGQRIVDELKRKPSETYFYSDSKVVLAYINNESKRFTRYVQRRIDMIHHASSPAQWSYVDTLSNPADCASRPMSPHKLTKTCWLSGPPFLLAEVMCPVNLSDDLDLPPEPLPELERSSMTLLTSRRPRIGIFAEILERLGSWSALLRVATIVVKSCRLFRRKCGNYEKQLANEDARKIAHIQLVREAQQNEYAELFSSSQSLKTLTAGHRLASLAPFVDENGLLRVGGRLKFSSLPLEVKHPLLIPSQHPIGKAIMNFYHRQTKHQGRHVTHSAIRQAGYHIENARREIRSLLKDCVICRRLRASLVAPQMADLPSERSLAAPPFTAVGLDVFGHWMVNNGQSTRRNSPLRKCWALIFACLASRAVHVECLPSLDTSTFINALKRFIAIRGPCQILRSDQGSNFIGAKNQQVDVDLVSRTLLDLGSSWIMNPPHASHFGGVWERKIGQIRRSLDAALRHLGPHSLTYDELSTLLQEAAGIVNATPLWETSYDPNDPVPITPNNLLTQKFGSFTQQSEMSDNDLASYGKRRWRKIQVLANLFWKSWRQLYLQELQRRNKWKFKTRSLHVDDVVLVREKNCVRSSWPIGVVEQTHLSHDGVVRSATLRVASSAPDGKTRSWIRPASELVLLQRSEHHVH